jgi:wyosine [tRNA(Phe)-imidazoG37] synthetase (radical SAM superfamily)
MKRRRVTACTLFEVHGRSFPGNRYVYPVLSRRAGGLSIGVNLNRDKSCNFRCIYCQVDRSQPGRTDSVDAGRLTNELEGMIDLVTSGRIFQESTFGQAPAVLRRLNDIALSGDGEPTTHPDFELAVDTCAAVRRRHQLGDAKLVLITNASMFHLEPVRRALQILDANHGEIWAKLDVGTEAYYRQIARTTVPFRQILENLREAALGRPIVIQTLLVRIFQGAASPAEQEAYCQRLNEIVAAGGQIKLVQIHTVARTPAETWVSAVSNAELEAAAARVRRRTGLAVATFPG